MSGAPEPEALTWLDLAKSGGAYIAPFSGAVKE
jgi:hypothetical protein